MSRWVLTVRLTSMGPKIFDVAKSSAALGDELPDPAPISGGMRVWLVAQDEWTAVTRAKKIAYPGIDEVHLVSNPGVPEGHDLEYGV